MTVLASLADFVCASPAESFAADQRSKVRSHVADTAIALVAGARSPEGQGLFDTASGNDGAEQTSLAAAIIRSTEVDDIHLASCTTPSSVAVPVALMMGSSSTTGQVESAVRVGIELMVRLGLAIDGPSVLYKGVWPTCFAAPICAAATAARIWSLDQTATAHALSLALMMSAGRTGRFSGTPTGRWILLKAAVDCGLRAATAARLGYKGDLQLLDNDWLQNAHGLNAQIDVLTSNFDEAHGLSGLSLKPFSTARQALAPTQALMDLIGEGLPVDQVKSIMVRVPAAYVRMISQPIDATVRGSGYVSAAFQMALAAKSRAHLWDLDRSAIMNDAQVLEFAAKISVEPSTDLQALYPNKWPAEIEVQTEDAIIHRSVLEVRGDAQLPLSDDEWFEKTRNLLEPLIGDVETLTVWRTTNEAFESPAAMARLSALMVGSVSRVAKGFND